MARPFSFLAFVLTAIGGALLPAPVRAQAASPLAGVWTLNRPLSEFPSDIGFNASWFASAAGEPESRGSSGGRGGRGSGGGTRNPAAPFATHPESYEDARRIQTLTAEARNPAARLMIVDTPAAVTFTNELGQSRTLHPDGREETVEIQGAPIAVTSRRDGDTLVVIYHPQKDHDLRYTYSHTANPSRLVVDVQFLEHGTGDKAKRVYDAGLAAETAAPPAAAPASPGPAGQTPAGQTASGQPAPEQFDQRPGAELRGLTSLGILVEELGAQAIACGLNRDTIESALAKRLTASGFTVHRNSDEDTYVYVNVMTNSAANGMCVSRYDAFLYTQGTAKLSYRDKPVLVQVSLIHRGGMGTSAPATHAAAVLRGLQDYIDLFVTQIHDASK